MTISRHIPLALLLGAVVLLAGCQGAPRQHAWAEPAHGLVYRSQGAARSLAMDAVGQRKLAAARAGAIDPWYIGRNDAGPSVVYGERYTVFETTTTLTRDQQTTTGGRVSDRFNQTTYRRRVTNTRR